MLYFDFAFKESWKKIIVSKKYKEAQLKTFNPNFKQ